MTLPDPAKWLVQWFATNTEVPLAQITEGGDVNYLETGWIDSFRFITFLGDVEQTFGIRFGNDEFMDTRFATMNGMCRIILEKANGLPRV